jgi:ribosome biogenesis protein YTM1
VGDQGAKQFGEDAKPWSIGSHSQPVLSVSSYFRGKNIFDLASCSQDSSVLVRRVEADKQESKITHKLEGHEGAVEHVEFDPTGKLLATCAWDDTIKVWDLNDAQATKTHISGAPASSNGNEMDVTEKKKSNKRSKVAESKSGSDEVALIPARSTLVGHNQCVSTLQWISADQLVSGSWDHSLRFWDVESGVCTKHFDGNKVILSLDHSELNGLVATGHADKTVRTWDPRVSFETSSLSTAYTSHTGWVSAVSWHPTNANLLISASFDTSIKVWDLRSTTPLHTMPSQHQDKVTTLAWLDADTFVSGGADKFVRTYSFPNTPSSE